MKTGTDVVDNSRFIKSVTRRGGRLRERLFTTEELACNPRNNDLAVMFSVKEAVAKALGTGFDSSLSWHDIQIFVGSNDVRVLLSGHALVLAGNRELLVSATCGEKASFAFALLAERD
jgi:holo-[acyl-carrier-protein] synthase